MAEGKTLSAYDECKQQHARLDAAGARAKGWSSWGGGWMIEAVYTDGEGIGDLMPLTSVADVDAFLGSWCPECGRIDRRRTRGGACSHCRLAVLLR